jgi:hypothetical protein
MAVTQFVSFFLRLPLFIDKRWQHHLMLCNLSYHIRSLNWTSNSRIDELLQTCIVFRKEKVVNASSADMSISFFACLICPYISDDEKYALDEYYGVIVWRSKSTSTLECSIAYMKRSLAAVFLYFCDTHLLCANASNVDGVYICSISCIICSDQFG